MSSSFINIQDTFPKKKRSSTSGISEFYLRNRRDKTGLIYYLHHKQIPGQRQAKMRKRKRKRKSLFRILFETSFRVYKKRVIFKGFYKDLSAVCKSS